MGDGRAEGLSAIGDGGQASISLMPDTDGTGSGSSLDSIPSTLLTKRSSDAANFVDRSMFRSCASKSNSAFSNRTNFRDWTCEPTFASLKVCNLKVRM